MIKLSKLMTFAVFVLLFGCSEDNNNSVNESQNDAMTDGSANRASVSSTQTQALEKARAVEHEIQKRFDGQRPVIDHPID